MTSRTASTAFALVAIAAASTLASAAPAIGAPRGDPTLPPSTSGSVPFLTGGIGEEERDALSQRANDYNLQIWLARAGSGHFLADVRVSIEDARGRVVLDTMTGGPWLLVRVPPGRYVIRTDQSDEATAVTVAATGNTVSVLRFPGAD